MAFSTDITQKANADLSNLTDKGLEKLKGYATGNANNIGDIGFTVLSDLGPGRKWTDGSEVSKNDFRDLYEFLQNNPSEYLSKDAYENKILESGICTKFGYDEETGIIYLPKIENTYVKIGDKDLINPENNHLDVISGALSQTDHVNLRAYVVVEKIYGYTDDSTVLNPFFFGCSLYSQISPDNGCWLKANGQFVSGKIYKGLYDWLLYKLSTTPVNVKKIDEEYTDYDFVVDETDTRFRLPLLDGTEDLPGNETIDLKVLKSEEVAIAEYNGTVTVNFHMATKTRLSLVNGTSGIQITSRNDSGSAAPISVFVDVKKGDEYFLKYDSYELVNHFKISKAIGNGDLYWYIGNVLNVEDLQDIKGISDQLNKLEDTVEAAVERVENSASQVEGFSKDIDDISAKVDELEEKIDENEEKFTTDLSELEEKVNTNTQNISKNASDIDTKATKATDFVTEITDTNKGITQTELNATKTELEQKIEEKDSLPAQTGNDNKWLKTDGTDASWEDLPVATDSIQGITKLASSEEITEGTSTSSVVVVKQLKDSETNVKQEINTKINGIEAKIPAQATATNQLADKDFVNSSIQNMAAKRVYADENQGYFESRASLLAATTFYNGQGEEYTPTTNDYTIVLADEGAPSPYTNGQTRWIYASTGEWEYNYGINTTFTSDQMKAIDSGITAEKVAEIAKKQDKLTSANAGNGISIDENGVISNTQTSAEWGNIQGDIKDQKDLQDALEALEETIDEKTITRNSEDALQTVAVIDQNNNENGIKTWTGTKAQWKALTEKDDNTLYNVTDDNRGYEPLNPYFYGQSIYSPIKPNNDCWLKSDGTYKNGKVYEGLYNWLVENKDKNTYNGLNINIVGNLTNKNGIVSGFSSTSYGLTPEAPSNVTSYEIVVKFFGVQGTTTQQGILANSTTNLYSPQIVIGSDKNLYLQHPKNNSTWVSCTLDPVDPNKTYWVKMLWDGKSIYFYTKEKKEDSWFLEGSSEVDTCNWTEKMGIGIDLTSLPLTSGSIDLNETYININGKRWWTGIDTGFKIIGETGFNNYDFIIDEENQTFRLPLLDGSEDLISEKFDNLTVPENGKTITAVANGWLYMRSDNRKQQGNYYMGLYGEFSDYDSVNSNGFTTTDLTVNVPVKKGSSVIVYQNCNDISDLFYFKFIYAQGNGDLYYYSGDTEKSDNPINLDALQDEIKKLVARATPTGTILPYGGTTPPEGYLICDGSEISRSTYSDLFSILGTAYGAGNGETTFNLPDLNEKYLAGNNRAYLEAGLPNITGAIENSGAANFKDNTSYGNALKVISTYENRAYPSTGFSSGNVFSIDASRSSSIYGKSSTVQPNSCQTYFIIKF